MQRIDVRSCPFAPALAFHVLPPSVVASSVFGPTAKPFCGLKNHMRRTMPGSIPSIGFQELPASVVENAIDVPPGGDTNAMPASALVKAMSTARLPLGLLLESVPGIAV